jgi:hypothetical protein
MKIDASRQIAQMPIVPLRCVDGLQGKGLKLVFCAFSDIIYNVFQRCVDLAPQTLTGQGLLNELPTDWVNSD